MFVNFLNKRIFLISALVLVVFTVVSVVDVIVTMQSSGMAIVAFKLEEEPDVFFVLEDPDPIVLKAFDNVGEPVVLGLFGVTKINELINFHNTGNVSYLDEFYEIGWLSVDYFGFGSKLLLVCIIGWVLLLAFLHFFFYKR